jgi:FdrA protein
MPEGCARVLVKRNLYADSVTLLQASAAVNRLPGVLDAAIVMGTPLNQDVLRELGLPVDEAAGPNDLLIAVRAVDAAAAEAALAHAETLLTQRNEAAQTRFEDLPARSVHSARRRLADANLAMVSVPGPYAAAEADQALSGGLHVFLFSDNVPLEDEVRLKRRAREAGLLVMGPDCGTAVLNGVGLGFANAVRKGRIGLVGASGTGLQEVSVLLHHAGEGVSQAIGTGSRDLRAEVGGTTTLQALELLRDDPHTERIVLISKPADAGVAERVLRAAAETGKPVVACLLGVSIAAPPGVQLASNLLDAARLARGLPAEPVPVASGSRMGILGLYCGGTLAEEASLVVGPGHRFVDLGDDQYTRGRAHPMIDPTLRNRAIREAAADRSVSVLLLDVILGYGAHADPAGVTVGAIHEGRARNRQLAVLAHVVGTEDDPQGLARQEEQLRDAGVQVYASNVEAVLAARELVTA